MIEPQKVQIIQARGTHQRDVHGVEDLADVVVELLRLRDVVADPEVALQVDVLDEQRVEGVDVARDHVPLLLDLPLHLRRVVGRSLQVPPARSDTSQFVWGLHSFF